MIKNVLRSLKTTFVFCYHRVIPEELVKAQYVNRAMYVTPQTFDRHVKWMKTVGQIVGQDTVFEESNGPRFMITFDDGWQDTYTYALPILRKYAVPAIVFISTNNIDQQKLFWSEEIGLLVKRSSKSEGEVASILEGVTSMAIELSDEKDKGKIDAHWNSSNSAYILDRFIEYLKVLSVDKRDDLVRLFYSLLGSSVDTSGNLLLSWEEIDMMQRQGCSFGSHTHTHPILDRMGQQSIDRELSISKQILENRLGRAITLFSYPNGCFNSHYIQTSLRKHGYKYAFTLERTPVRKKTNPFLIPRCLVYEDIGADLEKYYLRLLLKSWVNEGVGRLEKLFYN